MAFGGFNADRVQWNNCGQPDDPNLQRLCDDSKNDLPLQKSLKLSGFVPAKWGIIVSGSWQNLQGYNTGVDGHSTGVPSSYLQPSAVPPARFVGFGLQVRY